MKKILIVSFLIANTLVAKDIKIIDTISAQAKLDKSARDAYITDLFDVQRAAYLVSSRKNTNDFPSAISERFEFYDTRNIDGKDTWQLWNDTVLELSNYIKSVAGNDKDILVPLTQLNNLNNDIFNTLKIINGSYLSAVLKNKKWNQKSISAAHKELSKFAKYLSNPNKKDGELDSIISKLEKARFYINAKKKDEARKLLISLANNLKKLLRILKVKDFNESSDTNNLINFL